MSIRVAGVRSFGGHGRLAGSLEPQAPAAMLPRAAGALASIANIRAGLVLLAIVAAAGLFKFWLTPTGGLGPYSLIQTPTVTAAISHLLATDPLKLFLPYEFEGPGRWLWAPAMLLPQHGLYQVMSPLAVYLLLSSLLVVTSFVTSWLVFRSLVFSGTLAFALAFGTHFAYGMAMGFVFGLYLLLSYVCLNLMFAARLTMAPSLRPGLVAAFALSLVVVALSVEWWLNYAAVLLVGSGFFWLWAKRHGLRRHAAAPAVVFVVAAAVLLGYLSVRLPLASEYVAPGGEEELISTYNNSILAAEDLFANFFTLTYMSIANYLPIFGSISQTYIGDAEILAEQHGYHSAMSHLVVTHHVFLWRFYAGAAVAFFVTFGIGRIRRAFRAPNLTDAVLAALFVAVLVGCGTHLVIKYRPYMSVPALTYKPTVSIFFVTVLIAYLAVVTRDWFRRMAAYRTALGALWLVILIGAFTRPAALNEMLRHVGVGSYGDPLRQLLELTQ
jgi:hypothetical protein